MFPYEVVFSTSVKNCIEVCVGTALNLKTAFGRTAISQCSSCRSISMGSLSIFCCLQFLVFSVSKLLLDKSFTYLARVIPKYTCVRLLGKVQFPFFFSMSVSVNRKRTHLWVNSVSFYFGQSVYQL